MSVKAIGWAICAVAVSIAALGLGFAAGRNGSAATAAPVSAMAGGESDRADFETMMHDYIVRNPEVLVEAQQVLEARQQEQQKQASAKVIDDSRDAIFNAPYDGVIGNPAGKTTVVEFFDYNCPYCKHALSDMQAMVKDNPDLRFVLKELPILGPDSQRAHVVSMAFRSLMPEKYGDFHRHLLGDPGKATEAKAIKLALDLGADEPALRKAMQDPTIAKALAETYDLSNKLAITGTPSYVIGKEVVFGALGKDVLEAKAASATAM